MHYVDGNPLVKTRDVVCGAVWLLLGLWVLLAPYRWGSHVLLTLSPILAVFLMLWLHVTYIATALGHFVAIPALAHSFGVSDYHWPPSVAVPLLLQLALTLSLAGLARNHQERIAEAPESRCQHACRKPSQQQPVNASQCL